MSPISLKGHFSLLTYALRRPVGLDLLIVAKSHQSDGFFFLAAEVFCGVYKSPDAGYSRAKAISPAEPTAGQLCVPN